VALGAVSTGWAQQPRYVPPAGSPLPNELNYFRRDVGVLDPYNTFVRPRRELAQQLRAMEAQQRSDYASAQQSISQLRASQAAPTGVGAGFMNYSHYYNLPSGGQRPLRR
jgi:hypothetical protein